MAVQDISDPDAMLSLVDAARLIPGATADTLKRRARQGLLRVYKPGKKYLTSAADVRQMVEACRVAPRHTVSIVAEPDTALASAALDAALAGLSKTGRRSPA